MKHFVNYILGKFGLELRRTGRLPIMSQGLSWLSTHDFKIQTVLDVGASNGNWTKECIKYFPQAKYILFEPQPVHCQVLDKMVSSSLQSITPVKKAVGASDGVTFFDVSSPFGGALMNETGKNTIEVELTTIDKEVTELNANGPFLLKLDTHGFEKEILDGSTKTLENCSVLIIEAYNYRIADKSLLFWELCAFLETKGFRPIDLVDVLHRKYDKSLWQMDLIFIQSSWNGFNYISYT